MNIPFEYVPILGFILSWFLAWMISGFPRNSDEMVFGNILSFAFSMLAIICMFVSMIYYPIIFVMWVYNSVSII